MNDGMGNSVVTILYLSIALNLSYLPWETYAHNLDTFPIVIFQHVGDRVDIFLIILKLTSKARPSELI